MNYISNADRFIALWDAPLPRVSGPRVRRRPRDGAYPVYPPLHPRFNASIEPRARPLVLGLIAKLRCVTYSSCGGHRSTLTRPFQPLHVGILPRDETERRTILERMLRAARITSRDGESRSYRILVHEGMVESDSGEHACIDLYLEPRSAGEDTYFRALPFVTSRFLAGVEQTKPAVELSWPSLPRLGGLRTTLQTAKPYPYLVLPRLLSSTAARDVRAELTTLPWAPVEREAYRYEAIDVVAAATPVHTALNALVADLGAPSSCRLLSTLTGLAGLSLDYAHAHRMHKGDGVAPHFDALGHDGCCRLVISLSSRRVSQGGAHLILRERKRDFVVQDVISPRAGRGLLFLMGLKSYHAVSAVKGHMPRLTLVATYRSK